MGAFKSKDTEEVTTDNIKLVYNLGKVSFPGRLRLADSYNYLNLWFSVKSVPSSHLLQLIGTKGLLNREWTRFQDPTLPFSEVSLYRVQPKQTFTGSQIPIVMQSVWATKSIGTPEISQACLENVRFGSTQCIRLFISFLNIFTSYLITSCYKYSF